VNSFRFKIARAILSGLVVSLLLAGRSAEGQQQAPSIGYMYPPGGRAGSTVEVVLGGYDWTPDTQVFVHDPQMRLEVVGDPGPVIVPEPPYWFEKKARRSAFLMPREIPAVLTIPAEVKPGVYRWQAANANGATATGRFIVSGWQEMQEHTDRREPQDLTVFPSIVSGQIRKIEEVDRYRIIAPKPGPVTLQVVTASIGSPLNAVVEVREASGRMVAEESDTEGKDLCLTFVANSEQPYIVSIYDLDFRGNRAFVYRLATTLRPHVVTSIPAVGNPGTSRDVEFIGYGISTGEARLESLVRHIDFPRVDLPGGADTSWTGEIETPTGCTASVALRLTEIPEVVEPSSSDLPARTLTVPSAVTGILEDRFGVDRYWIRGTKGDSLAIEASSQTCGSELDLVLSVRSEEGQEIMRADDLSGSTDASFEWSVPEDGLYELTVSDISGRSGNRAATYRLAVCRATPGFTLSAPEFVNLPIGDKATLEIKAARSGGFAGSILLDVEGLPPGVAVSEPIEIPADKSDVKLELTSSADSSSAAQVLRVKARAEIGGQWIHQAVPPIVLAMLLKPPFSIDAEGQDDVTKWPRGSTFPAPILVERIQGFDDEIVLEMAARQGRHRQGIRGPELKVAADAKRVLYPIFLPQWLETTRTSRMVVNGVARIADPTGKLRFVSSKMKTRIGFLPTGALLTLDCQQPEIDVLAGGSFTIPLTLSRARDLQGTAVVELVNENAKNVSLVVAEPIEVGNQTDCNFELNAQSLSASSRGELYVTVRATVMVQGLYPVVSETEVLILCSGAAADTK